MKTQIGTAITGDLSESTMTFDIEGEMILCAGKYAIVPIEDYDKLVKNNGVLDPVSGCYAVLDEEDNIVQLYQTEENADKGLIEFQNSHENTSFYVDKIQIN